MTEAGRQFVAERLLGFAERIATAVKAIVPKEPVEIKQADRVAFSMYWRLVRYFDAEMLLIQNGLPEEAFALARGSFEDSLRLAEMDGAGTGRASFEVQWVLDSYAEQESLMKEAQRLGIRHKGGTPTDAEVLAKVEEWRAALEGYRTRNGVGRLRRFSQEKDAAKTYGRDQEYWTYRLSHNMVHGSDLSQLYFNTPIDGGVAALDRTWSPELRLAVFEFAATSVLRGAQAMARMFQWPGLQKLVDLDAELDGTMKGINPAGT